MELQAILLFYIYESQLSLIKDFLETLCPLELSLVQLLSEHFVCRVFKVGAEVLQVLLFLIVVFLFHLTELALLSIEGTCYQGVKFAAKEVENCLGDNLANFYKVRASFTELADAPNAEVLCLAAHALHERG